MDALRSLALVIESASVLVFAVVLVYLTKVAFDYLRWVSAEEHEGLPPGTDVPAREEARVRTVDQDRVEAFRLRTLEPRWLLTRPALAELSEAERSCLFAYTASHYESRGDVLFTATFGVAFVVLYQVRYLQGSSLYVVGLLLPLVYLALFLRFGFRRFVFRADHLAARECGAETYRSFLETAAAVEGSRPRWERFVRPTAGERLERLERRFDATTSASG